MASVAQASLSFISQEHSSDLGQNGFAEECCHSEHAPRLCLRVCMLSHSIVSNSLGPHEL